MNLILNRKEFGGKSTIGELYLDGEFECYTLEDVDRYLETGGIKVPQQTAIPRGKYPVIVNWSNRFKRFMPLLENVPGFAGVRIHAGNTAADTEGCILVGQEKAKEPDTILKSRLAYDALLPKIDKAHERGEEITIEIL